MLNFDPREMARKTMESYAENSCSLEDRLYVKGKVAVVTGGTSGLGFCVARRLLQGGARVVVASHNESESEIALPMFEKLGFTHEVSFCKCDVTKEADIEHLMNYAVETYDSLDILVTCAGIWSFAHIEEMPEEFIRVVDVNLHGTFRAAKHASRIMIERGIKGKMCLVSSDVFTMPGPIFGGYAHYAASKGGIVAMTVELARELYRYGIIVNTLAPGGMTTPGSFNNGIVRTLPPEKQQAIGTELRVLRNNYTRNIDDVAIAVYTMCTNAINGIVGECLICDYGAAHNIVPSQPAIQEYPPKKENPISEMATRHTDI